VARETRLTILFGTNSAGKNSLPVSTDAKKTAESVISGEGCTLAMQPLSTWVQHDVAYGTQRANRLHSSCNLAGWNPRAPYRGRSLRRPASPRCVGEIVDATNYQLLRYTLTRDPNSWRQRATTEKKAYQLSSGLSLVRAWVALGTPAPTNSSDLPRDRRYFQNAQFCSEFASKSKERLSAALPRTASGLSQSRIYSLGSSPETVGQRGSAPSRPSFLLGIVAQHRLS
jgi:hypothetical protein